MIYLDIIKLNTYISYKAVKNIKVNDKDTIQSNNLSILQANQGKNIAIQEKKSQYFKQYDAPISDAQIFAGSDKLAVESGILI